MVQMCCVKRWALKSPDVFVLRCDIHTHIQARMDLEIATRSHHMFGLVRSDEACRMYLNPGKSAGSDQGFDLLSYAFAYSS